MSRLVFFGTPEFSLPSLKATYEFCQKFSHELSLVICQPDKPKNRGQKITFSPVKESAIKLSIPTAQPITLKKDTVDGDNFYQQLSSLKADLAIVVAYGKIIPERMLKLPRVGFVNIHASLLPRFRGAAPIQRAIESGDKYTGVCLMDMTKKLDEGDIFTKIKTPILSFDTQGTLFHRLSHLGAQLLYNNLNDLLTSSLKKQPQEHEGITYAFPLEKHEGQLDFTLSGQALSDKVRSFDPWPGAFGYIKGKRIKFFNSFFIIDDSIKPKINPGTIIATKPFLGVKTIDGAIYFQWIQVEGKKELPINDAILGFAINIGDQIRSSPG
jgi:methionyl-tRNA formyltransferase